MKLRIFIVLLLISPVAFAQVTTAPTKYGGQIKSFSGLATQNNWSKDSLANSRGIRHIMVDNSKSLDTLKFGFQYSDTSNTKCKRLLPGEVGNYYYEFVRDIVMFWRAISDTTKPIQWHVD